MQTVFICVLQEVKLLVTYICLKEVSVTDTSPGQCSNRRQILQLMQPARKATLALVEAILINVNYEATQGV
ncbi:MAG: hypothetical protein DRQ37_07200 [Gammaproteobacteria bacterium]|nr:MAG: hypothetical protein DRQ37_07200 [Gammaproteobacteria bacterium]